MSNPDPALEESIRRVRRGCAASALIFVALTVLFIGSTGNLAFSLLLIVALILFILSRTIH